MIQTVGTKLSISTAFAVFLTHNLLAYGPASALEAIAKAKPQATSATSADEPRWVLETYGDSLTAGFLSHTALTSPPPLSEVSQLISDLARFKLTGDRKHVSQYDSAKDAWPTILKKTWDPIVNVDLRNYAVSGARSYQLINQVRLARDVRAHTFAIFFIGHNDMCENRDPIPDLETAIEENFKTALGLWDSNHLDSEAYILPIGNIHEVYKILRGFVWSKAKSHDYTCEESWDKYFPYCRAHFQKFKSEKLDEYLVPRLTAANSSIGKAVDAMQRTSKRNHYHYVEDIHQLAYLKEAFAVDCFHLSSGGQSMLAERVHQFVRPAP